MVTRLCWASGPRSDLPASAMMCAFFFLLRFETRCMKPEGFWTLLVSWKPVPGWCMEFAVLTPDVRTLT